MKKIIRLSTIIFILLSSLNCLYLPDFIFPDDDYDDRIWYIDIENKLSYSVKFEAVYTQNRGNIIRDIQPNEIRVDWILNGSKNAGQKAHKRIKQISVYKETDNNLIMLLKGSEIDKYVIYTGISIYGIDDYQFLFQIKEENLGVGINKTMRFEEENQSNIE